MSGCDLDTNHLHDIVQKIFNIGRIFYDGETRILPNRVKESPEHITHLDFVDNTDLIGFAGSLQTQMAHGVRQKQIGCGNVRNIGNRAAFQNAYLYTIVVQYCLGMLQILQALFRCQMEFSVKEVHFAGNGKFQKRIFENQQLSAHFLDNINDGLGIVRSEVADIAQFAKVNLVHVHLAKNFRPKKILLLTSIL